ncbi:MAG: Spy/CpxP family protein refolding chaperone [Hyphomicrobiales bacterium]|nr:Spy/CpxP family protein refolding chaperone [Pseudolabrys sp.]MBV9430267.1 Spy/CpxP family protein refolding chaperone [Hyphomicrobiales bacterium]MBV9739748.1 Spy/CpxP family protein refolding chaperone [Hyphomicrobiales bacterium]
MSKTAVTGFTALFLTASSLSYAQTPSAPAVEQQGPSAADLNALTDARVAIVKAALQLTPEQAKYWPPVEEAIRNRAMGRHVRLAALAARLHEPQVDADPFELLRQRADGLAQRSAELKQLANAWEPLYASLNTEQKARLRFFAVRVLHLLQNAGGQRHMEMLDEDDEE